MIGRLALLALAMIGASAPAAAPPARAAPLEISIEQLWGKQPQLIDTAAGGWPSRVPGRANVYALAVAAGGKQALFAREAKLALDVAAARFGQDYRGGVLLSNAAADLLKTPLAVPATMAAAAKGLGGRLDSAQDIAIVYLASHGGPDATLETDLPGYDRLLPVSAQSVAEGLKRAGIRRRIIIVSACFAGSWAPALADDDTILIAAARRDRTSFGCDNSRRLTFFGEAMLEGPLRGGASLHEAFDAARARISGWEAAEMLLPSHPQAFVGKHMRALWDEHGGAPAAPGIVTTASAPVR